MSLTGFVVRNAVRNRRRFVLTVSSVAVSLFLLIVLEMVLLGLTDPAASDHAALRIVVRHKVSLANMLFAKQKTRIEKMPGVVACTKLLWFGGIYKDEKNFFPQFACDPADLFQVMADARIAPEDLQQFQRERTACLVGAKTMRRFGWQRGDRITLLGAMWPCNLELTIRGEFTGGVDETNLYFHHAYLDELLGDQGFTGLFWVRAASPESATALIDQIDAEFASSDAETLTETERSFQLGFLSLLGNIRLLIRSISTVIVFTLLLVAAGTMSMAVRERVKEIAILKAIGFDALTLFGLILVESVGLALLGGILGCLLATGLAHGVDLYQLSRGLFVNFAITPRLIVQGLFAAGLLGAASCLVPAWTHLRRSVVDGLRATE